MKSSTADDLQILRDFLPELRSLRIALLYGPKSYEDAVYFDNLPFEQISSGFIAAAFRELGLSFIALENTTCDLERHLTGVDVVFVNMHGEFGEDGAIQGLLQYLGKPYTGSGVFASALACDKTRFKRYISLLGFPTPSWRTLDGMSPRDLVQVSRDIGLPIMLKLVDGGSSVGMHALHHEHDASRLSSAIATGIHSNRAYFAERLISGRDMTVSLLELPSQIVPLPILEVKTGAGQTYDETAKLDSQRGEHVVDYVCPADLPHDVTTRLQQLATDLFREIGCRGFARIDFILSEDGTPYCLELNTIPGLQRDSNFLQCVQKGGMSAETVFLSLLYSALHRGGR